MGTNVTDQNFDAIQATAKTPVLVEFYATWCGNCRRIEPNIGQLETEFADRVRLLVVNAEENPELTARFEITSTPTLIVLDGKNPVMTVVGAQTEQVLWDVFDAAASATVPSRDASWVPKNACTLPSAEQPRRLEEFENLFATTLRSVAREEPTRLRLGFAADTATEQHVRDITARESECCTFFDFTTENVGSDLILDIRVPLAHAQVLTGIEQQAASAHRHPAMAGSTG